MSIAKCLQIVALSSGLLVLTGLAITRRLAEAADTLPANEASPTDMDAADGGPLTGTAKSVGRIPNTGDGVSGFVAAGLWHVYCFFPSEGRWDWLLLFCLLAVLVYAVFWPHLWKAVQADMRILAEQRIGRPNQGFVFCVWGVGCLSLLLWFFHTPAGTGFLMGREWSGLRSLTDVNRPLFWISLGWHLVAFVGGASVSVDYFDEPRRRLAAGKPQPFTDRSILNLYLGGGIFYDSQSEISTATDFIFMTFFVIAGFHVFYWYWSAASIILMLAVSSAAILNEVVRMTFVYVLHKRTFG